MTRWGTAFELEKLKEYTKNSSGFIVEIGVFDGETTRELALSTEKLVFGIDPIVPDSMPPYEIGSEEKIKNNLYGINNVIFIRDYSYNCIDGFRDQEIGLLFIDGSHIYEDVKKDFELYLPKVLIGGFIFLHDSAPVESIFPSPFQGWPGPTKLATELKSDSRVFYIGTYDTLSVFMRVE